MYLILQSEQDLKKFNISKNTKIHFIVLNRLTMKNMANLLSEMYLHNNLYHYNCQL